MTNTFFIRLLQHEDKGAALAERVAALREGRIYDDVYAVNPESFRQVPNTPFCYWVSERIRRLFTELPPFESEGRTVKQGLATADDFRFVRAWWEVPPEKILDGWQYAVGGKQQDGEEKWTEERIREFQGWCRRRTFEGKRWVPFAKGGEYSPYYADIHLLVNWEKEGAEIKQFIIQRYPYLYGKWEWVAKNSDYYFRPGLTWPRRTQQFGPRVMPACSVFADKGPAAFVSKHQVEEMLLLLSLMLSRPFGMLVELSLNAADKTARSYEVGILQGVPVSSVAKRDQAQLGALAHSAWSKKRSFDLVNDTSHAFILPVLLMMQDGTLVDRAEAYAKQAAQTEVELQRIQAEADEIAFDLYGFTEEERKAVVGEQWAVGSDQSEPADGDDSNGEAGEVVNEAAESGSSVHRSVLTGHFLQWCVGVALGRWDVRFATGKRQPPELPDPFDPLPVCPPGMLQGPDGLPAKPEDVPSDYPIRINWEGILVDDPEHQDDIVRRVRDVLEMIWKDRSEAIEKEACEILGVRELRDYFRKSANGGFWMDHVKRYSKSRRKAPIYWYLRSSRGNYGLWLYYHRLDKDILFKALMNYVEPKIRLEEDRLNTLRARKQNGGTSGRVAKEIEREIDRLEQFVSELQDFAEKLHRAADLQLDFDLNDGVILNMAPLWELIPWNQPKKYWEELQEGKYDWAHIAYQLWPERVKEKCKTDRSLAIAHGLEEIWEEFNKPSRKKINR